MGNYQNGFRVGRSVIDNIFILKIINKKLWSIIRLCTIFIDLQKANDSMHRDTLWKCIKEFKIPSKLIHMCKHVYKRQEVWLE